MYTIKIDYITGNSFGSEEATGLVGASWNNIKMAKEALKAIKEHQEYVENLHKLHPNKEKYTNRSWFVQKNPEYLMYLRDDFEHKRIISCFWVGYFEHIQSAEIIQEDNDMKIKF